MTDARQRTPSAPPGFANGATLMQRRGSSPASHLDNMLRFRPSLTSSFWPIWAAGRLATGARLETGQLVLDLLSVALQRS